MVIEDPRITAVREYGLPEAAEPRCPVCDKECDTVYVSTAIGTAIGCEDCISYCIDEDYADSPRKWFECPMCEHRIRMTCPDIKVYIDDDGEPNGCQDCVKEMDADEYWAEYLEM